MLLKSRGCRMQRYGEISSLNLLLTRLDTRKVCTFDAWLAHLLITYYYQPSISVPYNTILNSLKPEMQLKLVKEA